MAIKINKECICCNACLPECPNSAIYEPGVPWSLQDGTSVRNSYTLLDGTIAQPGIMHQPIDNVYYYIVPDKCTECQGFHDEPQCMSACPVDACVPDELYRETVDALTEKKNRLHPNSV
jgi:ferredoxin